MKDEEAEDEGSVSVAKYPVLPSLVSLQQMRNRMKMAREGHRLMKWSAVATGQEMRRLAECIYKSMELFAEEVRTCFILLARCRFYYPNINAMVLEGPGAGACATISYAMRTSAGVKIQMFKVVESDKDPYPHLGIGRGGVTITEAKKAWRALLKNLIAIMEYRMMFLAFEHSHNQATKKSNVLGKIIMPRTELTMHYILSELEEMAREEFFRLKKVLQVKKKLKMEKEARFAPKVKIPPPEPKQTEDKTKEVISVFRVSPEVIPEVKLVMKPEVKPEVEPEVKPEMKPEIKAVPVPAKIPCCEKILHLQEDLDELLQQTKLYKEKGGEGANLEAIQQLSRALREKLDSTVCYHDHATTEDTNIASIDSKEEGESQSTYSSFVQTLHNAASLLSIPHLCRFCKEKMSEPANKSILAKRGEEETKATDLTSREKVHKSVSYSEVCQSCLDKKAVSNSDREEQNLVPRLEDCKCSQQIEQKSVSDSCAHHRKPGYCQRCHEKDQSVSNSGYCQKCQEESQKSVSNSEYCSCSTISSCAQPRKDEENQSEYSSSLDKDHKATLYLQTPHTCPHTLRRLQTKTRSHTGPDIVPTLANLSKASVKYVKGTEEEQSIFSSIVEKIQKAISYLSMTHSVQTEAPKQSTSAPNQLKAEPVCSSKCIQSKKTEMERESNDSENDVLGVFETDKKEIVKILRTKNDDGSITEKITIIRVVKENNPDGTCSDCDTESLNQSSPPSSNAHSDKRTVGIVSVTFPKNHYKTLEQQRQSTHGSRPFPMANPLNRHCLSLISLSTVDYEFQSVCVSLVSAHQQDNEITTTSNEFKSSAELPQFMNSFGSIDITSPSQILQENVSESDLTSSLNAHEDSQNDKHKLLKDCSTIVTSVTGGNFQEK